MGIYERIGVRPLINAWGTHSYLGGSIPHPEVLAAMEEAAVEFVDTYELQFAVGRKLAELTHNEAAFVSASASAGLFMTAAAIMACKDEHKRARLPDTEGMKDEAIALASNPNPYAACVRPAGMKLRWVGDPKKPTADELERAIGPRTACLLYFADMVSPERQLPLEQVVEVCHRKGIPVVVDAAALIPPFENTWRFTREMGADVAVFSGGKGFRGPQCSGLVVGKSEIISAVMFFCPPFPSVARVSKISREVMVGLLAAVEVMARRPSEAWITDTEERLQTIHEGLRGIGSLEVHKHFGTDKKPFHHLRLYLREQARITGQELARLLDAGDPRIVVGERSFNAPWLEVPDGVVLINAECLRPGEEAIVVRRIREILGT